MGMLSTSWTYFICQVIQINNLYVNKSMHLEVFARYVKIRRFQKGPFAMSFEILLNFWLLFAISAIFANFKRVPLPSYLTLR